MSVLQRYQSKSSHIQSATISEEIGEQYYQLNKYKSNLFYITFKLTEDETLIVVDKVGTKDNTYNDFINSFGDNDIAWGLISVNYRTTDGGKRTKLNFITWVPDTLRRNSLKESARIKTQGVTQAGKLKTLFQSINCMIQANCKDDLQLHYLIEKASKNEREQVDPSSINLLNNNINKI